MKAATLLLVEDNSQDEKLVMRALDKIDLAGVVDVVRDGQEALDYLFREGEFGHLRGTGLPAAVLLDIGLPKLSGLEVLVRLRAHPSTRLLPIVMLTSTDDERDRQRSYRDGANSFVRKPVEFEQFTDTLIQLGRYWLQTNEPPPEMANA